MTETIRLDGKNVKVLERIAIRRPILGLSDAEIIKLHKEGKDVPMLEYTLVRVEK